MNRTTDTFNVTGGSKYVSVQCYFSLVVANPGQLRPHHEHCTGVADAPGKQVVPISLAHQCLTVHESIHLLQESGQNEATKISPG